MSAEYLVFNDEVPGFSKRKNPVAAYQDIPEFLDQHRKGRHPARRQGLPPTLIPVMGYSGQIICNNYE